MPGHIVMFASSSACHGVESFSAANLQRCVLLRRGHTPGFERVLRPRSQGYKTLTAATTIGSVVGNGAGGAQMAVAISILDLPALANELRSPQLAESPRLSALHYRSAALEDLANYVAYYSRQFPKPSREGWQLVPEPDVGRLMGRCTALLG